MSSHLNGPIYHGRQKLISALESRGPVTPRDDGVYDWGERWRIIAGGPENARLREALESRGVAPPTAPESLCIQHLGEREGKNTLAIYGRDDRGLAYALYEAAAAVELARPEEDPLARVSDAMEHPELAVRSIIKFFVNDASDMKWFHSVDHWDGYMAMLLANRFNRINLCFGNGDYFRIAYPFFVDVPGYNVRAQGVSPEERDKNLATLQAISSKAGEYGLDFYLGMWTHSTTAWTPSWDEPKGAYPIEGIDEAGLGAYCRKAVAHLLAQCPDIDGVALRINVEAGIREDDPTFWDNVLQGIAEAGRPVKVDLRVKGITFDLINNVLDKGLDLTVSSKFTAEHLGLPYHQAQIRTTELIPRKGGSMEGMDMSRRFNRYGYADVLVRPRDYDYIVRLWMLGTQKILLWGDPDYVQTLTGNSTIAGSVGLEFNEPLTYGGIAGANWPGLQHGNLFADSSQKFYEWGFQRYWYTFMLFGRLMYNPKTSPEVWLRELRRRFGAEAAPHIAEALRFASKTLPLLTMSHMPSANNTIFWPEVYTNNPIVETSESELYLDSPSPHNERTVEPLDTAIFYRVVDYVDDYTSGQVRGRYDPLEVSRWLQGYADKATAALDKAEQVADTADPELRWILLDVRVQAHLGRFFSHKLTAATRYELYYKTGDYESLTNAVSAYSQALEEWRQIVRQTKGRYIDDLPFGKNPQVRGHWADREEAIVKDLRDMEGVQRGYLEDYAAGPVSFAHVPLRRQRAEDVRVTTTVKGWGGVDRVTLHHRTDPSQHFSETDMARRPGSSPVYSARPPVGSASDGPLQYYMTATLRSKETVSYPAEGADNPLEIDLTEEDHRCSHTPPKAFRKGQPLKLDLRVEAPADPRAVNLFYRHLNQAEFVQEMPMANGGGDYTATIPGDYTDSPYDLLYYFEIQDRAGGATLYPGFDDPSASTPYLIVYAQ